MLKRFLLQQIDLSKNRDMHYFFVRFPLNLIVLVILAIIYRQVSDFAHEQIELIDHRYLSLLLGLIGLPIIVTGLFLSILAFRSWMGIFGKTSNSIEKLIDDVKLFLE